MKKLRHCRWQIFGPTFHAKAMQVGADGIRPEVIFKRSSRDLPTEASASVTDIEDHSSVAGLRRLRQQFAVVAEQTVAASLEAVSHDIARPQALHNLTGWRF